MNIRKSITGATVCAAAIVGLAACASSPIPDEKIAVAQASVARAEQSGAPEYAPVELSTARDKLQRAQKAAADKEAQPATMLAEQADVDAQLAEATAQEHKSQRAATELDASLRALSAESVHDVPPPPPAPAVIIAQPPSQ